MGKIWFIVVFVLFELLCNGQNKVEKKYSLQQCLDIAIKHNENLKTAGLNIEFEKVHKRIASDIPKTNVLYTQGQFNSIYKYDENITVTQSIPFPSVFVRRKSLSQAHVNSIEQQFAATKADLIYQVKVSYYSLLYSNSVHELLEKEDSIYRTFNNTVNQKFTDSKGTLLEKMASETQLLDIHNKLLESEEDINDYFIQLQTLINSPGDFDIEYINIATNYLSATIDTNIILDHPQLKQLQEQININKKQVKLERALSLPDISFSYFNQTIYGPANIFGSDYFLNKSNRLQGVVVGLALPLWYYPHKAKIESAKISTQLAKSNYDYHNTYMRGQYSQAVTLYNKYRKSLNFYKANAITNSKLIIAQALTSYNKGEINYSEYIQIVGHAFNIENTYLNVIHQNNMSALKIEYYLTK